MNRLVALTALLACTLAAAAEWPGATDEGYLLPNGWRMTPLGTHIPTNDLLLEIVPAPDNAVMVATHGGYNEHGLVVVDTKTGEAVQRIPLPTAWYGLAWSPDGERLFVSGGNDKQGKPAPIYVFDYAGGRLSEAPVARWTDEMDPKLTFWAGVAHHPAKPLVFAANRTANYLAVFDAQSGTLRGRIETEMNPYALAFDAAGDTLYCSNWASDSVSVIDVDAMAVSATIAVGDNPNDIALTRDGRLFVACANDNTVWSIDTATRRPTEIIETSLFPNAPQGSTPNSLALSPDYQTLYVANADNNNVAVVDIEEAGECSVLGFLPTGWYPSAVAVGGEKLYVGNAKGVGSYSNERGPHSPLREDGVSAGRGTVKSLQQGSVSVIDIPGNRRKLRQHTEQVYANCPYRDELLAAAHPPAEETVVPSQVGAGSKIKHVLYIIKENRTYDQVFGDLPQGNGDPRLCIFGREITPNHHAIAEQFVLFDNLYCDAEVSWDGHQWSNAAYATDYVEKYWPASYGDKSDAPISLATLPKAGYLWDQCLAKGLTYRSYGEFAERVSDNDQDLDRDAADLGTSTDEGGRMVPAHPMLGALHGHIAPHYYCWGARDYENAEAFIKEFDEYEKNFESPDPRKRLPNYIVMALPEDHTHGARPGRPTVRACVASNDLGLGMIVDRVSHSKYWPQTAIFVIEDDAQDGPDHVDARRTVGLVISPYTKRGFVDSTLYTTSSMLRTIELLLGLQPMSQFDAAATPMYNAFTNESDLTPYAHRPANIDVDEMNDPETAWGVEQSLEFDLSTYDRCPMFALNEVVWKNMKGADSEMPLPVHRFHYARLANQGD